MATFTDDEKEWAKRFIAFTNDGNTMIEFKSTPDNFKVEILGVQGLRLAGFVGCSVGKEVK